MEVALEDLRKKKENLSKLLKLQTVLQKKKMDLLKKKAEYSGSMLMEMDSFVDEDTKGLYDRIYPILRDIHRQELINLENKQKLEWSSFHRQKQNIKQWVKQVCNPCGIKNAEEGNSESDPLVLWSKEMKQMTMNKDNSIIVTDVQYPWYPVLSSQDKVGLLFSLCYKGFYVQISVQVLKSSPDESVSELKIHSDPHIPGVEDEIRQAFNKHLSSETFLTYTTSHIESDILCYL